MRFAVALLILVSFSAMADDAGAKKGKLAQAADYWKKMKSLTKVLKDCKTNKDVESKLRRCQEAQDQLNAMKGKSPTTTGPTPASAQ